MASLDPNVILMQLASIGWFSSDNESSSVEMDDVDAVASSDAFLDDAQLLVMTVLSSSSS